jgi:hypothetical protein
MSCLYGLRILALRGIRTTLGRGRVVDIVTTGKKPSLVGGLEHQFYLEQ